MVKRVAQRLVDARVCGDAKGAAWDLRGLRGLRLPPRLLWDVLLLLLLPLLLYSDLLALLFELLE